MLKLSWAMLCHVEAISQILFGHVVGFASRKALPPAGPRFSVVFCELCWLHLGVKYVYLMATLVPSWANFGDFGAVLKSSAYGIIMVHVASA